MKTKRRIIAVLMMICLLISCSAVSTFAASGGYVRIKATQNYGDAQKMLKLINKQRSKRGLRKLKLDKGLTKSAAKRAAELTIYIPESSPHRRPNGRVTGSINGKIIYECCAEGYGSPSSTVQGWMSSAPHRKGILLSNARSVGIGCITSATGDKYWTLEFSSSGASRIEKRKTKVKSTYKIYSLGQYLKKKNFSINLAEEEYMDNPYAMPTIYVGESAKAGILFKNNFGFKTLLKGSGFTWKSSRKSVATVDKNGKIRAKKPGSVTITAKMKAPYKYVFKLRVDIEDPDEYDDW